LNHPHIDNALADALRPCGLVAALGDQRVGQILVAEALKIPGGTKPKEAIGALAICDWGGKSPVSWESTLVGDAILLIESQRPIQMDHAKEFPTLHLAKVTLAQSKRDALKLMLRLHLEPQLSTMIRQAADGQDIVNNNSVG